MKGGPWCRRCLCRCRAVATFVFSHVGLMGLVVGYTLIGAFTFEALEVGFERELKKEMTKNLSDLVDRLWVLTTSQDTMRVLYRQNYTSLINGSVLAYEKEIYLAVRKLGYDGVDEELQWTFSGAMLYSIIVITSIGYGNVAPKTTGGKIVTILYAVFGIPLMLLCMSNIGDTLAQSFKFVYWKICCFLCIRTAARRRARRRAQQQMKIRYRRYPSMRRVGSARVSSHRSSGHRSSANRSSGYRSARHSARSRYDQDDRYYAAPQPLKTVDGALGRRDYAGSADDVRDVDVEHRGRPPIRSQPRSCNHDDGGPSTRTKSEEDLRVDLPTTPTSPSAPRTPKAVEQNNLRVMRSVSVEPQMLRHGNQRPSSHRKQKHFNSLQHHHQHQLQLQHPDDMYGYYDEADEDLEDDDYSIDGGDDSYKEHVTVPIWLCCALVTAYICGGGLLFSVWESWDYWDACYFCFITLTTIGFGDMVPGKTAKQADGSQATLVICALYLLFGMALLAMSFNLVQEQVTNSMRHMGQVIGIIEEDDTDEE